MQQMWEGRDYYLYFTPHTEYIRLEKWTNLPKVWLVSSIHTEIWDLKNWANKSESSGFCHKPRKFKIITKTPSPIPPTWKKKKMLPYSMYLQDSDLNYEQGGRLCVGVYKDAQKPWHCPILLYQPDDKACISGTWDFSLWTSPLSFKLWCLLAFPSLWEV